MFGYAKTLTKAAMLGAVAATFMTATPSFAEEGDAVKGEKVYKKCRACHMVGEGAKNRVGPVLTGVVGRKAGTYEGYKYSKSMQKVAEMELMWTEEELIEYLADPKKYLRAKLDDKKAKTKMIFKLKKEKDRKNVVAYLKTFSKAE